MKPFCPDALPWQPPALQPALVKIGTTWFEKLTGGTTAMSVTVTGTAAVASPSRIRTSAFPFPRGVITPSAETVATAASLLS